VSMNSTIKPFDNLNVRKAVVAASDRKALQLTRGGTAAGDLATHFLPERSRSARTSAGSRTSTTRRRCLVLDAVFNGKNILPANHSNWTQLNVPAINAAMGKAALLPAGPERNKAWGQIDDMITAQAPGVPFLWDKIPTVESSDVRGVVNQYSTSWDLDFTSLK
ncbi:MAG TPA: hypothetical protein VFY32_02660, partial [Solirubrobacteraceae bacterium]|nr:hypothetical protein [Solirubrobacteraceae bacterium]